MLFAITESKEIKKLNERLKEELLKYSTFCDYRKITYRRAKGEKLYNLPINYSDEMNFWWYFNYANTGEKKRYWNIFGVENPNQKSSLNITCEINMPLNGISFRTAGMWARDKNKNVFLLHSGKIGGSNKGVGKNLFWENFHDIPVQLFINNEIKEYAVVAQLGSQKLGTQLSSFVNEISRIKGIAKQSNTKKINNSEGYNPEFSGQKTYGLPDKITTDCNHGIIVDYLKKELDERKIIANNNNIVDLYTLNTKQSIERIFEIKTALSRQTIYTAIGQLFLNSASINSKPDLIFVCPSNINKELIKDLNKMNILVLTFKWVDNVPYFNNIDELFRKRKSKQK